MDFARKQLEKYGWAEGKGLGKNEDGIAAALKPKLKFDNSGVGHEVGAEYSLKWWERLYNNAAGNINVNNKDVGVQVSVKDKEAIEITTKSYSIRELKKNKHLKYGSFLKTEKLTQGGVENFNVEVPTFSSTNFEVLTDEQLFEACGGRTAHKGARHGLKLCGKLSRIEKQEKMLMKKMRNVTITDIDNIEKKMKKIKKHQKELRPDPDMECPSTVTSSTAASASSMATASKKIKKRKSVTFCPEAIINYYTPDGDSSADSQNESNGGPDEGIEQDFEENNNNFVEQEQDHRSFEEAQTKIKDLSKAERKKLKKKRKLEKQNTATSLFLRELNVEPLDEFIDANKKRKHVRTEETPSEMEVDVSVKPSHKMKKCKKRKKEKKCSDLQGIAQSLDNICRLSDDDN